MVDKLFLLLFLCGAFGIIFVSAKVYETEDAIVVEANITETRSRSKRDTLNIVLRDIAHNPVTTWGNQFGEGGHCVTSKATFGKCTSFKTCYPYFKKIPDLGAFDSWVLGQYDTCTYLTDDGRQAFGVCCVDPPKGITSKPVVAPVDDSIVLTNKDTVVSNWPPAFITHPPNHTPPTHPAISGSLPVGGAQFPTTTKRPIWPPPVPTHPTFKPIQTTTQFPNTINDEVYAGNYCGSKNGKADQERIVGGSEAGVNEYPWVVALFNNGRQFCGGSLIDTTHILTAAHCVAHMSSTDVARMTVNLGDHNIRSSYEVQHITRRVKRVVRHRSFDPRTLYNDIALLTLESPVQYSRSVRPICLPTSAKNYGGQYGMVAGWGSLRENGPQPSTLQKVSVPIWTNTQCRQKYGAAAPGGIVDHMICAGRNAMDSCSGDSGGPLMVTEGHTTYQIGVVSWGIGCGQTRYPGVYTRVTSFMPWITKNLQTK